MKQFRCLSILVLLFLIVITKNTFGISHYEILQAMRDELKRSMDSLFIETLQKPYYIEYSLKVSNYYQANSFLGSLTDSSQGKKVNLNVKVRVGDYKLDNTNFLDFSFSFFLGGFDESGSSRNVPVDFDYFSLRREFWLATDFAYKNAAKTYSKKISVLKNRVIKDTIPDFAYSKPNKFIDTNVNIPTFDFVKVCKMLEELSKIFLNYPIINSSIVSFEHFQDWEYFVNSEGTEYIKPVFFTGFEAAGTLQTSDGMPINDFYSAYSTVPNKLPEKDSLEKAIVSLCENLVKIQKAKTLEDSYSGPVLFTEQAAGELFAQVFIPNLLAQRSLLSEQGTQQLSRYTAFQTKIGGRVLPEFLSIYSVPLKSDFNGVPLLGYFKVDDEGTPAENIPVVQNGYLKTLLSNRTPIKRILSSNANDREGSPMFGNIEIVPDRKYSKSFNELKQKMMQLCKQRDLPFGIIVKKIMNQNLYSTIFPVISPVEYKFGREQNILNVVEAYKVYPDGREEVIRGVELKGITTQSFKDIILVGNRPYVLNILAPLVSSSFSSGGYIGASVIVPDILIEDAELRPIEVDFPKPPFLENPLLMKN
ncbi:MAG: metallopeptidase TldD-related protein [Ignavibacteria bacterium]|nr:metallopeptidase TldD-related protein [Ignavibacteria bacterium]